MPLASSTVITPSLPTLFHGLGDQVTDRGVVVCRYGTDLGDIFLVRGGFGHLFQFFHHQFNGPLSMPRLMGMGFKPGGCELGALAIDGPGQNGCRGGTRRRLHRMWLKPLP